MHASSGLCATLLAGFSIPAFAAGAVVQTEALQPVVVTATLVHQSLAETLTPVTVVTKAQIERLQARTLPDVLAGLPGITMANSGGAGQQTSLFLRGASSTQTLVLVDGVRIGSVGAGLAAYAQLPVDQIQRIEIVRGPRSTLYGSDAIGGVIQIFTRRGHADAGLTPALRLSVGSHHAWQTTVGLSGGSDHAWFNASVGSQYTRGINSCRNGAGTLFVGCFTNEPDKDGYRAYNGLFSAGYRFGNGAELTGVLLRAPSQVHYDGTYQNFSHHLQQVAGMHLKLPVNSVWSMQWRVGQSKDQATNFKGHAYTGFGNSTQDQAGWLNTLQLAQGQLLNIGVDYLNQRIASDIHYLRTHRANVGVFAEYQGRFGTNEIELSARHDENQQFGSHYTGAIAWGYHFAHHLTVSASFATAFHAPTFNDLYYPALPGFPPAANPHLVPEKSRNVELDVSQHLRHWHWSLAAYRNRINDLIALDKNFTPGNISRARIRGIEGQAGGRLDGWIWRVDLTVQQPEDREPGPNFGNVLARRFKHSARFDLDRTLGRFSVGGTLEAFGHRFDDAANTRRLGGYGLLALRGSWHFAPHWQVQGSLRNALDHDYETVYYYNEPGRTWMLTVRYTAK